MTDIDIFVILEVGDFMEMVKIFKALSDPTRLEIVNMLQSGERCACVILEGVPCVQSTLSHHLKILVEAQVINARRDGKWTHYSINREFAGKLKEFGNNLESSSAIEASPDCRCMGE